MERLWEIVEKEKILVYYEDLSYLPEKVNGLFIFHPKTKPVIILDKQLLGSWRLHKCVLAEEIGHYFTTPRTNLLQVHTSANLKAMSSQDERKAMKWATDFLIPDDEFLKAVKAGHRSKYELAEYFDVTEWFIQRKIEMIKTCYQYGGGLLLFERL